MVKNGKTSKYINQTFYQKANKSNVALLTYNIEIYFWKNESDSPFKNEVSLKPKHINIVSLDYSFDDKILILCENKIKTYDFLNQH